MPKQTLKTGVVHTIPADLRKMLISSSELVNLWNALTPLARNEWICWICSAKKQETRAKRIDWAKQDLRKGKRRPCCWAGCPHR